MSVHFLLVFLNLFNFRAHEALFNRLFSLLLIHSLKTLPQKVEYEKEGIKAKRKGKSDTKSENKAPQRQARKEGTTIHHFQLLPNGRKMNCLGTFQIARHEKTVSAAVQWSTDVTAVDATSAIISVHTLTPQPRLSQWTEITATTTSAETTVICLRTVQQRTSVDTSNWTRTSSTDSRVGW